MPTDISIWLVVRADLINVAGLKVTPEEVERVLNTHPAIIESACVGASDPQGMTGECVKAILGHALTDLGCGADRVAAPAYRGV